MNVTLNTDASFSYLLKKGAYAFWVSFECGPVKKTGLFKGEIKTCHQAEMRAILNGIKCVFLIVPKVSRLFINTDSDMTITLFNGLCNKRTENKYKLEYDLYQNYVKQLGFKPELRKIQAHSGDLSKRGHVNDWCDKTSRATLRTLYSYAS